MAEHTGVTVPYVLQLDVKEPVRDGELLYGAVQVIHLALSRYVLL